MTWRWTFSLAVLAVFAGWLAPRLRAAEVEQAEAEALADGPCFRWGSMECCYVDE